MKFKYSNDNKRYHTLNYHFKTKYNQKIFKVPLNANFSCPNRDGKVAYGGCTFCSEAGSGDFIEDPSASMRDQFEKGRELMRQKWPNGLAVAYFQAFSNTYAPLEVLKQHFDPFLAYEDVVELAIATRSDCLDDENIAYLDSLCDKKEVWLEIGLQTIYNHTSDLINRGHSLEQFLTIIEKLKHTRLKICVHIMNSLPYETKEMMIETAKLVGQLPIHAVKIHMLHILKRTRMGREYLRNPFPLLTKAEYIETVVEQLKYFPEHFIIQRLTGDGILKNLIAPEWTIRKVIVLNDIDKEMKRQDTYQGALYTPNLDINKLNPNKKV